jgi:hypothetical protein
MEGYATTAGLAVQTQRKGNRDMSDEGWSGITLPALLSLYQVHVRPGPGGIWTGRHPFSVRPGAALLLSADAETWRTDDPSPLGGDRLDFIMRMEGVTRERAARMLQETYPAVLEREGIDAGFMPAVGHEAGGGEEAHGAHP